MSLGPAALSVDNTDSSTGVVVISEGPGKTGQILTCSEASLCGHTWYANRVARGGWAAVQHVKHYGTVREPLLSTL